MNIHKVISTIIHPIVVPTIGVTLYFLMVPVNFTTNQKFAVLSLIFVVTYLIPLLLMIVLKQLRMIRSFKTETIKERKFPIAFMSILFYLLGNTIRNLSAIDDLSLLFYASALALAITYFLFFLNTKLSIHLLSLGLCAGFFMLLSLEYSQSFLLLVIVILLFSGITGNARLVLKKHLQREVYLGFLIGLVSPIMLYFSL